MSKSKKKQEEVIEYDIYPTVLEYTDKVEELYVSRPDARKKKLFQEWLSEINYYASAANKLADFKIYGKFK